MSQDRLAQLLKQKQLIQDHLAWIEQEIAKEQYPTESPSADRARETANRLAALHPTESSRPLCLKSPLPSPESEPHPIVEIYDTLGPDKKSAVQETKRGCLMLFALAMGSVAAALGIIYYIY